MAPSDTSLWRVIDNIHSLAPEAEKEMADYG